ncbi:Lipase [Cytospora mali]|uniref:Lipase n=1 Tax=Cytospora mali TaxID=578113 RepID=A0A194VH43_CYTMA|nr:Lipase [Valsa mali]
MKHIFEILSLLLWSALGSLTSPLSENPVQIIEPGDTLTELPQIEGRDLGVNTEDFSNFMLYAQYAGASYCNPVSGKPVYCKRDICPAGRGSNATILSTFQYVYYYQKEHDQGRPLPLTDIHESSGIETDVLGFIGVDSTSQEIVISVRGSMSLTSWIGDVIWARELTSMCDGCWAHFGFLFAYREIASSVNTSLASAVRLFPSYKITVTGHSLGGAVATLLGMHIRDAGYDADIYTYGSPRVGNEALARYITHQPGSNYRVTHLADAVARLPPMQIGFRHTSPEYWLSDGYPRTVDYDPDDVAVCKGYYNAKCNSGAPWWLVDLTSHFYYLVAISHCGESTPRLSLGSIADDDVVAGPVNGTTATNGTTEGLDPAVADNIAMQAKLDQAYASALAASSGAIEIVF